MPIVDPFKPVVLQDSSSKLQVHVLPWGLTIHRILLSSSSNDATTHDLIVGPESEEDHYKTGRSFLGPVIGRYANRLPAGKASYKDVDGNSKELDIPEFSGPGVYLHGGPHDTNAKPGQVEEGKVTSQAGPLDRLVWTPIDVNTSQLYEKSDSSSGVLDSAIFAVISPADDNGLPGQLLIEAQVSLVASQSSSSEDGLPTDIGTSAGSVKLEYRSKLLDQTPATPLNITQHWFFNLSASSKEAQSAENGTIDDHQFRFIDPVQRVDLDEKMVPNGKLVPCPDEDPQGHGLSQPGPSGYGKTFIQDMPQGGYDHFYTWGSKSANGKPKALLHSSSTKITLSFTTNQTGSQVYTANGQPDLPALPASPAGGSRKKLHQHQEGEEGGVFKRSGVALEFGQPHATFLNESLQEWAGTDTLLKKGEVYKNWTAVEVWEGS